MNSSFSNCAASTTAYAASSSPMASWSWSSSQSLSSSSSIVGRGLPQHHPLLLDVVSPHLPGEGTKLSYYLCDTLTFKFGSCSSSAKPYIHVRRLCTNPATLPNPAATSLYLLHSLWKSTQKQPIMRSTYVSNRFLIAIYISWPLIWLTLLSQYMLFALPKSKSIKKVKV